MAGLPGAAVGRGGGGERRPLYSSIAGLNKSSREKKNILEVKLVKLFASAKFKLDDGDLVKLLTSLNIQTRECEAIQACPLGKPVVFITLRKDVKMDRFAKWRHEGFMVKEGISTARIGPKGKTEVSVQVVGLDPETKDEVVMNYLAAHGDINWSEKVIHHVYKGGMLEGLATGNRSYTMKAIKKELSSYHIIDGTKVEIRFEGQNRSCGRCYQPADSCPAEAKSSECQSERADLVDVMRKHWATIGYEPQQSSV